MKQRKYRRVLAGSIIALMPLTVVSATAAADTTDPLGIEEVVTTGGTERLMPGDREAINQSLGYEAVPAEAVSLRFTGEKIEVLDAEGAVIPVSAGQQAPRPGQVQAAGVGDEIKRVVGACLGIDFFGAVTAWEAIESQVNTWNKAAKFVLRRVGLIAALSCGGGIFAEYLL